MSKRKAVAALKWSATEQVVQQVLFFGISVTMARLVAPEAYGTVALLHFFTGLASVFVDGGFSSALIQRRNTTLTDESTVFWFNLTAGLAMAAVLFVAAPWIAAFYEIDLLVPITRVYALHFLLGACNSVHNALFQKKLDFKTPLKITTVSAVGSAILGISLAWHGFGVWALVWQTTFAAVLQTVTTWVLSSWRPKLVFSFASFRSLFRFSGFLFLSGLLDAAYLRFYNLIIGKIFGVRELGLYNRADATKQLPTSVLTGVLSKVAFPLFSQAGDEPDRLRRGLRVSIRHVMLLNIPIMLGVATVAEPLILTLFGVAWAPAVPLLQILALGGILWPMHVLNLNVLKAMGHSSKFFKVELVKKVVGLSLVVVGSRFGLAGMAWAMVASSVFSFTFNAYYNYHLLDYGPFKQARDFGPAALCGGGMAVGVFVLSHTIHLPPPGQLAILSLSGVALYALLTCLARIQEAIEALRYITGRAIRFLRPNANLG